MVDDHFGLGIDDTHIKLRGAPVLDEAALDCHQKMIADKLTIAELMTSGVTVLPPVAPVSDVIDVLRSCSHQVPCCTRHASHHLILATPISAALYRCNLLTQEYCRTVFSPMWLVTHCFTTAPDHIVYACILEPCLPQMRER